MRRLPTPLRCAAANRLRDTRGFMLGEQLISIIFLGLLCLVVAAGTGAAMNSYAAVTQVATAQSLTDDAVARINDELQFARDVVVTKEDTTFISSWLNHRVMLKNGDNAIVLSYVNETKTPPVVVASSSGVLVPVLKGLHYDGPDYKTWTYTIDIMKRDATTTGPGVSIKSTTITCQQIGN